MNRKVFKPRYVPVPEPVLIYLRELSGETSPDNGVPRLRRVMNETSLDFREALLGRMGENIHHLRVGVEPSAAWIRFVLEHYDAAEKKLLISSQEDLDRMRQIDGIPLDFFDPYEIAISYTPGFVIGTDGQKRRVTFDQHSVRVMSLSAPVLYEIELQQLGASFFEKTLKWNRWRSSLDQVVFAMAQALDSGAGQKIKEVMR